MAALFKQGFVFEGAGHGWTEWLYFEMPSEDVQAAINYTSEYKNKRRPLLGAQCSMVGQRTLLVQDLAGNPVKRVGLNNIYGPGYAGNPNEDAEDTGTSLLLVWSDALAKYKKNLFLGGAWASIFPSANVYKPAGLWTTFFDPWRQYCIDKGLGWRRRVEAKSFQITNHTTDPVSMVTTYTLTTALSVKADFGEGRSVLVDIPRKRSALDGMQVVIWKDETAPVGDATDWTTHVVTAGPRPGLPFAIPGRMRLYNSVFVTPKTPNGAQQTGAINAIRPAGRKRGRPLFVSRGRAPARPRA